MVTLTEAEGAVKALKALTQPKVLDMAGKNKHMFDKHISKAAAGNSSWFESVGNINVTVKSQWSALPANRKDKILKKYNIRAKNMGGILHKNENENLYNQREFEIFGATTDVGMNGVPDLLYKLLRQDALGYYEGGDDYPDRFVILTNMPAGYVGRGYKINGDKSKMPGALVKIVINASNPPQVVTAFPVKHDYDAGAALT
jgi:hypothetical protein